MNTNVWMKRKDFDELCSLMKAFEPFSKTELLPETYLVVRVDGSNFHQFTEKMNYKKPFDEIFSKMMRDTIKELMAKYPIVYAYTQSDEASFLFDKTDFFKHRVEKIDTIISSEFASRFGIKAGAPVAFDGRVISIPSPELVIKYFIWRMEDANRNSLNQWLYWTLRHEGMSGLKAGTFLEHKGHAFKNEELHKRGINYNTIPTWTKVGVGFRWIEYIKNGYNPIKNEAVEVNRTKLEELTELSFGNEYETMINTILNNMDAQNTHSEQSPSPL